ncbi:uncharacterized protein LOC129803319 [Phlebotomus papatasi]|uniref:uncharacterized protein LOC129803319 n=1 Tax=Phlebotomus papatasi TaxID=29031 RepID=UPI0024847142|nr:uncharacterized protein LOC129803319 [Phlebotomus papatasi]
MAEGTYEYECMRAELLGIDPPDRETFEANRKAQLEAEQENLASEQAKELEHQDEQLRGGHGKLDELNSILSMTQQRITKFKTVCGSLTNLLKIRPGSAAGEASGSSEAAPEGADVENASQETNDINSALDTLDTMRDNATKTDTTEIRETSLNIQKKMTAQFDALDSLLNKAENAQYSMEQQNKEMKKFLR